MAGDTTRAPKKNVPDWDSAPCSWGSAGLRGRADYIKMGKMLGRSSEDIKADLERFEREDRGGEE